ncbi:MAG: bifunctional riboflavin kinase/FAD synthetase [Bacteroidales bacterium]|nr:bifunctional riboflavin kinase/FAD synthetase [Bacteroidales bacterium]
MKIFTDISDFKIKNTVVTIGTFDGVHKGHKMVINRLNEISTTNNFQSVVFTFEPHPRILLNPDEKDLKLLNTTDEKITLLEEAGIDNIILFPFTREFSKLSACEFVKQILVEKLNIKYLVVGFNHQFGKNREGDYNKLVDCAKEFNFKIEKLDPLYITDIKISSTKIRKALNNGEIKLANSYLGYEYSITGKVIGGKKTGRKLGFPTANIKVYDSYKQIPRDGVYVVEVFWKEEKHIGMLNIGIRPTIDGLNQRKSIEVHIINFNKKIYYDDLKIVFKQRLRDEQKFDGVGALKNQLMNDRIETIKIMKEICSRQ